MANNAGSATNAVVTGNTFGTPAAPVGKLGNLFGVTVDRRRVGGPTGNVRFDNNVVTNTPTRGR